MGERTAAIATRLEEKGQESLAFFRALADADWRQRVYSEGAAWVVRDIMGHFVSAERSFLRLFENIMQGGSGSPEDFDLDRFNEREVDKLAAQSPAELLAEFEAARAAMVAFVGGLDDADLDRTGRHPFFGVDRLEKFLKLIYRHNMIHQRDIRRALDGV